MDIWKTLTQQYDLETRLVDENQRQISCGENTLGNASAMISSAMANLSVDISAGLASARVKGAHTTLLMLASSRLGQAFAADQLTSKIKLGV